MEQPRYREAIAGEGSDGPGWSRKPPGTGGSSGAWNGSCVRPPEEEDEDDRDRARDPPFPNPCGCPGEPTAPPSPSARHRDGSCSFTCRYRAPAAGPREEAEEDGAGEGKGGRRPRRQRQRQRSTPKEQDDGGGGGRSGRRQRRRSRGEGTESPGPAAGTWAPPAGSWGPVSGSWAPLTRTLRLLRSCCRPGCGERERGAGTARGWSRRVGDVSLRAARGLRLGLGFLLRLLWMLSALLLLLAVLLGGCLRLCWRCGLRGAGGGRWLRRTLGGAAPAWGQLWRRLQPRSPAGGGGSPGRASGGQEEVGRLLALAEVPEEELNPFEVLGVESSAGDAELRRAYRRLAVLVHPDKSQHPRAEAAFKVLRAAWDAVSTPERRRDYESKRLARSELSRSVGEFLSRLQEELRDAMNTMMCSKCQGKHRRFELQREPGSGRYCGECGGLHPAEEGDFWAESSLLGLKITYLAMMDGKIYDITEWAGCQRVGIAPDTHRVPYHISFGARGPAPPGRQSRSAGKGGSPSAKELRDFFDRIFQGNPGAMPGGSHPAPSAPPGAAGAPPKPEGAAAKGEAKHKRRKKLRRPLQR